MESAGGDGRGAGRSTREPPSIHGPSDAQPLAARPRPDAALCRSRGARGLLPRPRLRAASTASSGPTVPARPPCSTCCQGWSRPTAGTIRLAGSRDDRAATCAGRPGGHRAHLPEHPPVRGHDRPRQCAGRDPATRRQDRSGRRCSRPGASGNASGSRSSALSRLLHLVGLPTRGIASGAQPALRRAAAAGARTSGRHRAPGAHAR